MLTWPQAEGGTPAQPRHTFQDCADANGLAQAVEGALASVESGTLDAAHTQGPDDRDDEWHDPGRPADSSVVKDAR